MFFGLDEIRKFGEISRRGGARREVIAAGTFAAAPGGHSRAVSRRVVVPAPRQETGAFIEAVTDLVDRHRIDIVLPMAEESVYLAAYADRFAGRTELFVPEFEAVVTAHNKVTFTQLCEKLGLPVADYVVVTDRPAFEEATGLWPEWFARRCYGRGTLDVATNVGRLADDRRPGPVTPTAAEPWLVQRRLVGFDRCSFSVAHHGEVVLHATYDHTAEVEGHGGIAFESVESPQTLAAAQALAAELGWHGQFSLDFLVTADGTHHLVECNPRPTAGVTLATADEFDTEIFDSGSQPVVVEAGRRRMVAPALLRDVIRNPRQWRTDLRAARGAGDVYGVSGTGNHWPLW